MVRLTVLALLAAAACGNISRRDPDDASVSEPPPTQVPDAAVPREARELVSGSARMTGVTYTFEVEVGHAVQQTRATGATYQFEPSAAVKP